MVVVKVVSSDEMKAALTALSSEVSKVSSMAASLVALKVVSRAVLKALEYSDMVDMGYLLPTQYHHIHAFHSILLDYQTKTHVNW